MDVNELLIRAETFTERFEYDLAINCYKAALDQAPENTQILDELAEVLIDSGNPEEAKIFLRKSIELAPYENPGKYLSYAQQLQGLEAVNMSMRGIQVMLQLRNAGNFSSQEEKDDLNRQIVSAYCSVAEIYLTDSCFEENAEEIIGKVLEEAFKIDPNNPEPHQVNASYKISQTCFGEALQHLKRSHELWRNSENPPLFTFRLTTAKLYIELDDFESAIEVLLGLLEEIDTNPECWYLLGLSQEAVSKPSLAEESLVKALELLAIEERDGKRDEANLKKSIEELLVKVTQQKETVIESDSENDDEMDQNNPEDDD
jgi:tetratricopeptide (TPR) repeat protein